LQERIESGLQEAFIEHADTTEEYIVNLHALHNAHLICRHFPRHLTAPLPIHASAAARLVAHNCLAEQLRQTLASREEHRLNKCTQEKEKGKEGL
jgi:hypothetical protein